ncbi:non-ribosomal peptide synthetase, partial [Photorhabdus temperata]
MKGNIATAGNILKAETLTQVPCENIVNHENDVSMPSRRCVVVGGTTLAVFCAGQIQAAGHIIQAVLATDIVLKTWAAQQGIVCVDSVDALQQQITLHPIDWLFSIVNPIILPESLIEQMRGGAFNYHDSPLPRYAGSHATSWALLAGETDYAISWHCIEEGVDTGDIAVQWPVSIEEHDNAFSLNLKCYQAAQRGFIELLKDLGHGTLVTYPQDLSQRCFYALSHRPDFGGYLCWKQSGEALSALVRALDFGENYSNPLGCPKLLLMQGTVQISWLEQLNRCSEGTPGTLIAVEEDVWQVTTGSEDVRIGGFATLEGKLLSARELADISELSPGKQLPLLSPQQAHNIRNTLEVLASSESFWYERLTSLQPIQLPFKTTRQQIKPRWVMSAWLPALPKSNNEEDPLRMLLQTFVIYLARLIHQTKFQLGWYVDEAKDEAGILAGLAPVVPMVVEVEFDRPWRAVADGIDDELAQLAQHSTFSRDLVSRFPSLQAIPVLTTHQPWQIAVAVIKDDRQCDQEVSGELLTLQINMQGGFRWIYDSNRLSADVVQRMSEHLQVLASSKNIGNETPIWQLNLLPEAERTLLLEIWNATEIAYPDPLCIHQLFEQQVEKTPYATALVHQEQTLNYAELNTRANRLAHQLIALGVVPDQRVAICVARSPAMVVALLAVLKAGGAYVPLDSTYPGERLAYMLNDTVPAVVLADATGWAALGEEALAGLTVLDPNTLPDQSDSNPQIPALTPQHLAYVIYTSGSTGQPKGVMVEHQAIYQRYLGVNETYAVTAQDRVLQFATFAFDVSVEELFSSLCNGATLVMRDDSWLASVSQFIALTRQQGITVIFLPTLFWSELAARDSGLPLPDCLRLIIIGSEAVKKNAIQDWFAHETHRPRLLNCYGPTENTVTVTYKEVLSPADDRSIGQPLKNTCVYLLDPYGQPVPLGGIGEMYIGGVGVARGYLNRSELSAERFMSDPFNPVSNARMYRSGDLARYLPDGDLEFLGRNDHQVKIRGFRVELGEIETRLVEYPAVQEAVVLALDDGQSKRLVAYVAAEALEGLAACLREHLSAILPDYMVPAAFVRLDTFPQTPNGKLDRRALPAPGEEAFARQFYEAPQGETEIALAAIWCEVLGIEQISQRDNFFALGGHSLLAVRMMNRIAAFGVELPLTTLFKSPTLAAFAEAIGAQFGEQNDGLPAILPISREGELPLSFAQQRLWFLAQLEGVSETYHIPMALCLRGQLDIDAWQQALNRLFARHEALRSVFITIEGQPQVKLLPAEWGLPMSKHDLRKVLDADKQLERLRVQATETPFDLAGGPLIRAGLIQRADDDYVFLLIQHHIVSDGWSAGVLIRELSALYTAFSAGLPDPLLPLTVQYPDYAAWQRQWLSADRVQIQSDYWRTILADAPVLLDLPTDRLRPSEQSFAGHVIPINLDEKLTASLKYLSEQQGITLFMTLLSAWATVLSRLSGQDDVVIGTPSAGRNRQEVESLIGFFVNTLALRIDLSGAPNVAELLARVRQTALAAQEHQDLPFEQVVEIVQPPRRLAHTPLFQVMFAWQNNQYTDWKLPGLAVSSADQVFDTVKFDLELSLFEEDGRVVGALNYATALFEQSTIERHVGYLHMVLQAMVANPQQPVGEIDILSPAERRLLLETWNATETTYPHQLCIHQLFEQQAEKTPEATAIIYGEQILNYAELNARANGLARQLIAQGVYPDDPVAIQLERSIELVVAQLALLKAGAVYVPIDPRLPDERKSGLISDCSARLLITDRQADIPADLAVPLFWLTDETGTIREEDGLNPDLACSSSGAAYVMYTSGSTGTPKGVVVPHRAVIRLVINNGYAEIGQDDRVAFTANPAFDASTFEIWAPLLNGGTLVVIDQTTLLTPPDFVRALDTYRITVLWLSIGLFNRLAEALSPVLPQIKMLITGGEPLDPYVIAQVLRNGPPQQLLQAYGPTEGTTFATTYRISALAQGTAQIPIGRPIANTRLYLLDAYGQPVPLGATGEIYVGGEGIACGYLNRPGLTAERFLIDPFSDASDARMYRTGDLARYLPDGNLVFVGRNDQQVKIRGFRIEP